MVNSKGRGGTLQLPGHGEKKVNIKKKKIFTLKKALSHRKRESSVGVERVFWPPYWGGMGIFTRRETNLDIESMFMKRTRSY